MGKKSVTYICQRCIDFLDVRDLDLICDFCGYPGGNLTGYIWFGEKFEDACGAHHITHHPMGIAQGYLCCQQCKEFFARNPLTEEPSGA